MLQMLWSRDRPSELHTAQFNRPKGRWYDSRCQYRFIKHT